VTDKTCQFCRGLGWVCENHSRRAWSEKLGGCRCGAIERALIERRGRFGLFGWSQSTACSGRTHLEEDGLDRSWPAPPPFSTPWGQGKYGPGTSATEIRIGNAVPYSGPASAVGAIGKALDGYFAMVNESGGVIGRKIEFISVDGVLG
jgi:hypothetical protein